MHAWQPKIIDCKLLFVTWKKNEFNFLNQIVDFVNYQLIHVSNDALTNYTWPLHSWQKNDIKKTK
jgi:hypothetical protein